MEKLDVNWGACPDAEALMALAAGQTGLSDFGDPALRMPLEAYVSSLKNEAWAGMTPFAHRQAVDFIVHHLGTRLKLVNDRKNHPEISAQQIRRPMIIVGPPRSGSTLLHTLLSLDPENMAPEHWSCLEPTPPLTLGAPSKERLERADKRMMSLFDLIPDIFVTHPYMIEEGSGALAECGSDIMNMAFTSQQLWCFYRGESYRQYLLGSDHSAALRFHQNFLQHLQWGAKGTRWALKGSDHMLWMGELAAQYPDALLIWTHRDLAQQLGSLASIQAILTGLTGNPLSGEARQAVGRLAIEQQRAAVEKAMSARDAIGEDAFFDVSFHDVMAAPVRTVERIYERYGLKMSAEHADKIREWLANNPPTKHGVHKHSPEDFGMDAKKINHDFAEYVDRFGFGFGIRPPLAA